MSKLIAEVKRIDRIRPHPSADKLEIAEVGGWQTIIQKNTYKENELVIYICPDTLIPPETADKWGVKAYLSKGERVKCVRLRGEPSFGFIVPNEGNWPEGFSVVEHYGLKKYEPKLTGGNWGGGKSSKSIPSHPLFVKYTDIQNLRHYNNIFEDGEEVIIVAKSHGNACRTAMIDGQFMGGSRNLARRIPIIINNLPYTWDHFWSACRAMRWRDIFSWPKEVLLDTEAMKEDRFLIPLSIPGVVKLLEYLGKSHKQVILFGEAYGPGIQQLTYGCSKIEWGAYDLLIDGNYVSRDMFSRYCYAYDIPMLPIVYRGPYSKQIVHDLANRKTVIGNDRNQIEEGVVIRPAKERNHPKLGRVILKYISDEYLLMQESNRESFDLSNDEG